MGPGSQAQIVRFDGKCLYLLSHLGGSEPVFLMQYVIDNVYVNICAPVWVHSVCVHAC